MTPKDRSGLDKLIEDAIGMVSVTSSLERDTLKEATVIRMRKQILADLTAAGLAIVPVKLTPLMSNSARDADFAIPAHQWEVFLSASPFKETVEYEPGAIR